MRWIIWMNSKLHEKKIKVVRFFFSFVAHDGEAPEDPSIGSLIEDQYILPVDGHSVFVIQPGLLAMQFCVVKYNSQSNLTISTNKPIF